MLAFGEELKDVAVHVQHDESSPTTKPQESRVRPYVPLIFAVVIGLLIVAAIVLGSGGSTSTEARPKALIFLIDGLKATVFEEVAVHGYRGPNLQKLTARGQHAACFGS